MKPAPCNTKQNETLAFIFIALRNRDMKVIQKSQYADNETPKSTEGNQSLDNHLKSICMHLVQKEKVSYNDPQFTTLPLLKSASTSSEVSEALWTFLAEMQEWVGLE